MKTNGIFLYLFFLAIAMMFDNFNIIKLTVLSAFIHEAGHILAYLIVFKQLPVITASICGFSLKMPNCSVKSEIFVASAGCFFNFLSVLLIYIYINVTSYTVALFVFFVANLILGIINALPLSFLDGGRILRYCIPVKYLAIFEKVSDILSVGLIAFLASYILFSKSGYINKIATLCFISYFFIKTFKEKLQ